MVRREGHRGRLGEALQGHLPGGGRPVKGPALVRDRAIIKEGKPGFAVAGHPGTVFAVRDGILYYADFSPARTGCALVAYDLKKGKQLWKAALKGLGPISHFRYHNAVNLDLDGAPCASTATRAPAATSSSWR